MEKNEFLKRNKRESVKSFSERYFEEKNKETGLDAPLKYRFSIGADILFVENNYGTIQVKFAEINGHDSGNNGYHKIERTNENYSRLLFQKLRSSNFPELVKRDRPAEWKNAYVDNLYNAYMIMCKKAEEKTQIERFNAGELTKHALGEWTEKNFNEMLSIKRSQNIHRGPIQMYKHYSEIFTYEDYQNWRDLYRNYLSKADLDFLDLNIFTIIYQPHLQGRGYDNSIDFEKYLSNKQIQKEYLLNGEGVRDWKPGDSFRSSTGYWILKPKNGARQKGIDIIPNLKLQYYSNFEPEFLDDFIVEELQITKKPDNAPPESRPRNTFMRLRLDISYRDHKDPDKRIHIDHGDASMMVYSNPGTNNLAPDYANFSLEGFTEAYDPSEREIELAMNATKKVVHKLVALNEKDK